MRMLGFMPTEMELIEISQQISMCLRPAPPQLSRGQGQGGWAAQAQRWLHRLVLRAWILVILKARTLSLENLTIPYSTGRTRTTILIF